ncbi:hypothetical protein BJX63DRAFT_284904 [Aspergillus granulosus]|uniref:Transmembrane protein n=1 Tax=Aspergillus granulosus TaxID=176169 RepID=A0ABR4HZ70_9EURO
MPPGPLDVAAPFLSGHRNRTSPLEGETNQKGKEFQAAHTMGVAIRQGNDDSSGIRLALFRPPSLTNLTTPPRSLEEDGGTSFPSSADAGTGPGATAADLPKLLPPFHSSVACIHLFPPPSPIPAALTSTGIFPMFLSFFNFLFFFSLPPFLFQDKTRDNPRRNRAQTSPERRINPLDLRPAQTLSAVNGHSNPALFPDGTKPHRPWPFERSFSHDGESLLFAGPTDDVLTSSSIIVYTLGFFHLVSINFTACLFFSSSQLIFTNLVFDLFQTFFFFFISILNSGSMDLVFYAELFLKLRFLFVAGLFIINFYFSCALCLFKWAITGCTPYLQRWMVNVKDFWVNLAFPYSFSFYMYDMTA